MRRTLLVVGILGALFARAATGQEQQVSGIAGQVTADGKPIAGATVQAARPGATVAAATASTGADGRYSIGPLPQGVYRLEFVHAGFDPAIRAGIVVFSGSVTELNVVLRAVPPVTATTSGTAALVEARSALRPGEVGVRVETPLGFIFLAIDTAHAPVTSANFLKYVDGGFYNGGRFHRATRKDNYPAAPPNRPMMELIQGGINPDRRGEAFLPIPLERTSVTGLEHVWGTVSMARGAAADTATSDFFILLDDQPSLDLGGLRFDDGQGAAAFGRVIAGMDVVRHIQEQPVQGQNLTPPVGIVYATRIQ